MYLTTTNVGHPNLQKWKYTLPGDENIFEIERLFINVETGKVTPFKMNRDYQRSTTTDHIAGRGGVLLDANFSKDGKKLAFISSSRDHKEAHLKIADVKRNHGFIWFNLSDQEKENFLINYMAQLGYSIKKEEAVEVIKRKRPISRKPGQRPEKATRKRVKNNISKV